MHSIKPILLFGYGNVSRGDDALGPLLLEFIEADQTLDSVEILNDFQLQIEHALDLVGRSLVLFVDASVDCNGAFDFTELQPCCDKSYTSHAMSPAAVLQVYRTIRPESPPPSFLLSIQGEHFELGEGLSLKAQSHLQLAKPFIKSLLAHPDLAYWLTQAESMPAFAGV